MKRREEFLSETFLRRKEKQKLVNITDYTTLIMIIILLIIMI